MQERGWIGFAWTGAVEASAEVHVCSGSGLAFVFAKNSIGPQQVRVTHGFGDRPGVGSSPTFSLGDDIAEVRSVENACVLFLESLIEPRKRFYV